MQIRTRAYLLLHRLHIRWQHNTFPLLLLFFFHLYLPVRNHASLKVHVLFQSFIKICGHFSSDIFWAVLIHFQTLLNTLISYISLNNAQDADSSSNKHDSAPVIGTLQDVNNRNYIDFSTSLHVLDKFTMEIMYWTFPMEKRLMSPLFCQTLQFHNTKKGKDPLPLCCLMKLFTFIQNNKKLLQSYLDCIMLIQR